MINKNNLKKEINLLIIFFKNNNIIDSYRYDLNIKKLIYISSNFNYINIKLKDLIFLRNIYYNYEMYHEFRNVNQYLNTGILNIDLKFFIKKIIHEIKLLKNKGNKKILLVGSGPLPLTAILYQKFFKYKVYCIDYNKEYLDISKNVIKKMGINNQIIIINCDAKKFNYNGYTKIIMTVMLDDKKAICKQIYNTNKEKEYYVLFRTPKYKNNLLYDYIDETEIIFFNKIKTYISNGILKTIFFKNK